MDLYTNTAYDISKLLTLRYSSSFSSATRLFPAQLRRHIYAIYGLVRIADEIVDTYTGGDMAQLLNQLEDETYEAIERGYSTNPVVHAFALTACAYAIDHTLLAPFFASMRTDITQTSYDEDDYRQYIHGSAEVIGLMCLKVFCEGDERRYISLEDGAAHLGAAYQKINFLRDVAEDYRELGRLYFPGLSFDKLDDAAKADIIADIRQDLAVALPAIKALPSSARSAVATSYAYYNRLLDKLDTTPVAVIKQRRVRLSKPHKLALLATTVLKGAA